ncbi:1-acyl-sn-glycerol-3-phosphate acyltransferase [Sphingobium sp. B1D7B]|uniref:lysophospholipid acyltransferase family protein n=1 Tax=unclassified Sphingobium TaxID=2611147 RepID=UPI0022256D32|nr:MULTISPECIES: lysophospholipid acyltransferase family protein [unclassified Sphingobium]MCW2391150.1 1-acyl-sn-glycerol-3-phosphate acyltransferase [Sphingobium sp. B11D3A]MCW2406359.1 1-acyl-sn-glycerol-3-phosphate acyltransferase [Sphingobium sp. B1D7B]
MSRLRALARLARLIGVVIACVIPHLLARHRGVSPWPQRFLARAAHATGFDVRIEGTPLLHDVFFIANHVSWIDILALGGATRTAFISKDDVARAPIVGWLAAQNNTVFITRERRGAVSGQIDAVRTALAAHQPIALFPEGTTGDGQSLLPFKPALFSVLLPPPRSILIQPVVIDYGAGTDLVAWNEGESGIANALRILGARGRRTLTLRFLDPFDPGDHPDRKALAASARARLAAAMGLPG